MIGLRRQDVPATIQGDGIELRRQSLGDMTVAFIQGRRGIYGHQDYGAGQAFYWGPGHAPEIVEDAEYVDFSPTEAFDEVIQHITRPG